MRREALLTVLSALSGRSALLARRALAALAVRRRARTLVRLLAGPRAREHLRLAWAAARHRPDVVLAAVLVVGVLVMILHWS